VAKKNNPRAQRRAERVRPSASEIAYFGIAARAAGECHSYIVQQSDRAEAAACPLRSQPISALIGAQKRTGQPEQNQIGNAVVAAQRTIILNPRLLVAINTSSA
jgi:hypothetical protein